MWSLPHISATLGDQIRPRNGNPPLKVGVGLQNFWPGWSSYRSYLFTVLNSGLLFSHDRPSQQLQRASSSYELAKLWLDFVRRHQRSVPWGPVPSRVLVCQSPIHWQTITSIDRIWNRVCFSVDSMSVHLLRPWSSIINRYFAYLLTYLLTYLFCFTSIPNVA